MLHSLKQNRIGIGLMLASSICACVGQLLWKLATQATGWIMLLGFVFYGIGALFMIIAYRFGKVSILQPILSLNYVLSVILAATVLDEKVTLVKCIGVLLIILGVFLIATADKEEPKNASL